MGKTLGDFLKELEGASTELEKVAETEKKEEKQEKEEETKLAEKEETTKEEETVEKDKLAELTEAQGKILAHGFWTELQKLGGNMSKEAVGVDGMTEDPQSTPENPAVQLSREQTDPATAVTIAQLIRQLTAGGHAAGPGGYGAGSGNIIANAGREKTPEVAAQSVLEAEAGQTGEKLSGEKIISDLYDIYFGEAN